MVLDDALDEAEARELVSGLTELLTLEQQLLKEADRINASDFHDEARLNRVNRLRRDIAITLGIAHATDGVGPLHVNADAPSPIQDRMPRRLTSDRGWNLADEYA